MEKQIKIGKITLNCVLPYVKVIRYWKTDWKETHLKDMSLDELKSQYEAMLNEARQNIFWNQTCTYRYTHGNTTRIMKALIEVMETGKQINLVTIK